MVAVSLIPVPGIPEVQPGDDLCGMIVQAITQANIVLAVGDVVVVTQKIVSKAEGRLVNPATITPSAAARQLAAEVDKPPELVEVLLAESRRIVRKAPNTLILETHHGLICANAGVDQSNVEGETLCLLPVDPDASAERIRQALEAHFRVPIGVVISDTFGRPWRVGQTNVAIGVAGLLAVCDYRGHADDFGRELHVTQIAIADELAGAAELVMRKTDRVPVAVIRGAQVPLGPGKATDLVRPADKDLFR